MTKTPKYSKVLLKLSGEALAGDRGFGIEPSVVDQLTNEIIAVHEMGVSLGVVIGGGNIVRGTLASKKGMDRVQADYMGMLATVINALAVQDLLEHKEVATSVMTAIRMEEVAEPYIRRKASDIWRREGSSFSPEAPGIHTFRRIRRRCSGPSKWDHRS